jgi:predicted nucleic acid-binding protein
MSYLPDEAVKEFQEIYQKKCGDISFEKARIEAESFLEFFALITKPNKIPTKEGKDH